ncbi:MAG TPA: hypothetical protein VND94_15815 [Terriglobia bacterium]|nr:hypothetical protein [Terriglobia bacterium]
MRTVAAHRPEIPERAARLPRCAAMATLPVAKDAALLRRDSNKNALWELHDRLTGRALDSIDA